MSLIKLRVIFTCDIHGCFFPFDLVKRKEATGSLSRVSTYVKRLRQKYGENLILLDGGDILQGQPICYYSNFINPTLPNLAASVMNRLGYDAMAIGNHDIETGHGVYDKFRRETGCPVLAANVVRTDNGEPYFTPYIIIERDSVKIAVIGMTTQGVPCWQDKSLWQGMEFRDIKECTTSLVSRLREEEHPDLVIGIFHSGLKGGLAIGRYKENATMETVCNTDSIDLVLFGHDHKLFSGNLKNRKGDDVLCVNPSSDGDFIGDITITIEKTDGKGETSLNVKKGIKGSLINLKDVAPDADFLDAFHSEYRMAEDFLNRRIGAVAEDVRLMDCHFGDAPFSAFIHKIQLEVSGADISFAAPLSYDETLKAGNVLVRDAFKLYRYENLIYALRMTGKEIRDYLEHSYDLWINTMRSPSDRMFRTRRYEYDGKTSTFFENLVFNFDTAAGIDYTVDVSRPKGKRINIISMSDGRPFSLEAWYTVAMHSYRGNGGSNFLTLGAGIPFDELPQRTVFKSAHGQRQYIIREFEKHQVVKMENMNNWKFIPEEWAANAISRERKELACFL